MKFIFTLVFLMMVSCGTQEQPIAVENAKTDQVEPSEGLVAEEEVVEEETAVEVAVEDVESEEIVDEEEEGIEDVVVIEARPAVEVEEEEVVIVEAVEEEVAEETVIEEAVVVEEIVEEEVVVETVGEEVVVEETVVEEFVPVALSELGYAITNQNQLDKLAGFEETIQKGIFFLETCLGNFQAYLFLDGIMVDEGETMGLYSLKVWDDAGCDRPTN